MKKAAALERARPEDIGQVIALYGAVHDALEAGTNWTQWRRGVYPIADDAQEALAEGTLYVLRAEGSPASPPPFRPDNLQGAASAPLAATMILNRREPPEYAGVAWPVHAPAGGAAVVHTFMVHPAYGRGGYGARALEAAHALAREWGCACVRLDTSEGNVPAQSLYEKMGYRYAGRIALDLTVYGEKQFWVYAYELVL